MGSLVPSASVVDSLPSRGRVWVVMHHYFHMAVYHISAFHNMVKSIRAAVGRLLDRNPDAWVLVQVSAAHQGC